MTLTILGDAMVKGFYQMIARWGLVTVLFVLIVINMWQNDRMEAKQIKILAELKNMKRKMGIRFIVLLYTTLEVFPSSNIWRC